MNNSVKNGLKFGVGLVCGVSAYAACATILGGLLPDDDGVLGVIEGVGVGAISGWVGYEASLAGARKIETLDRCITALGRMAAQQTT